MPDITIDVTGVSRGISNGIVSGINYLMLTISFVLFVAGLSSYMLTEYDSTDSASGRSGMSLHIDNLTGCHYLNNSSLTPRISADGKTHYGCKKGMLR